MTSLTQEQRAALVDALERGGDTDLNLPPLTCGGAPDEYNQLTPAGRIVAELCRELTEMLEAREELVRDCSKWPRVMAYVTWRPIEECGELEPGRYYGRSNACDAAFDLLENGYWCALDDYLVDCDPDILLCHPSGEPVKIP